MLCAFDRIAADADAGGLAQSHIGGLLYSLIGQSARAGDHADRAAAVNMAWHNTDFAGVRCNHTGAVGPDQSARGTFKRPLDAHHVQNGNAFSDADDNFHLCVNGFENGVCREGGRHIDD